ncbi:hypothetical protein FLAT13_01307 [Flavobacterium salmonis]|uniref:Uncharacterized protein n=1 Tax=Flavobacterium salmonis TaxID=2654844 RepID=A0A6V6YVG0_9FLAO|nr:hypothetical protein FLAT13_01307 [Flavobacterium salmonis]
MRSTLKTLQIQYIKNLVGLQKFYNFATQFYYVN